MQKFGTSTPKDLVLDTAKNHHEGSVPKYKQTVSLEDEASGEQNREGSEREPQGIIWMKEEDDSGMQGFDPGGNNKANDLNSFILGDTDERSLDQTEVDTSMWKDVVICQLMSSSMLRVSIILQNVPVKAVVDTAAEVTIISDRIFNEMDPKPPCLRRVTLYTAGRDLSMQGFVVGPVQLKLGKNIFPETVYVAPIQDDMLLGLDFLLRQKVDLELNDRCMVFGEKGERVSIEVVKSDNKVAKVTIRKTTRIPPNSAVRLQCEIAEKLTEYMIEPVEDLEVVIPRTLHAAGSTPHVCMLNLTDHYINLKNNSQIAKASPVCSILTVPRDEPEEISEVQNSSDTNDTLTQSSDINCNVELEPNKGSSVNVSKIVPMKGERDEDESSSPGALARDAVLPDGDGESPGSDHSRAMPEHLRDLFQRSIEHLNPEEQDELADLLIEFEDVFAKSEFDLGSFSDITHDIDTGSAKPVKQRMRRTPARFANEEEVHLEKMLKAGVIQPSVSEWSSAPVLVRKRDGTVRWCVDYRALNSVTTKDVFPLPLVDDCLDTLAGNKWFSKLDANSAYWQIPISEPDCKKTAFITKYGLFEHLRMGFGLCNAPATYARVMSLVLRGLMWSIVLAFLDDILVLGSKFKEHLFHIREVLLRFRKHQLKLKPKKCILFQRKVDFLGRLVSEDGIELTETDIKTVLDWQAPQNTREVEQFLGLVNYHRNFIKGFAEMAVPLYRLTGKQAFQWQSEHQEAFEELKKALTTAPVLGLPNNNDFFILDTDASNYAIGAELIQLQQGEERVIAYGSFSLTPEQLNYCTTRKELLALVRFTRQFRHYLLGRQFLVRTDHNSLRWLLNFREIDGQLARWLEELSQYDLIVKHRPGRKHENADALSRIQSEDLGSCNNYRLGVKPEDLPCGGCTKCTRAHEKWSRFTEDVDDVVALTCRQMAVESVVEGPINSEEQDQAAVQELKDVERVWPWEIEDHCDQPEDFGECHLDLIKQEDGDITILCCPHMEDVCLQDEEVDAGVNSEPGRISQVSTNCPPDLINQVREGLKTDKDLETLCKWLVDKEGVEPEKHILVSASPAAKFYWINKELFYLEDDLLWKRPKFEYQPKRLVIPDSLRELVMEMCHEIPSSGHQSAERTMARVKYRYFWYGMAQQVTNFVATCDICNRNKKPARNAKCPLTLYHAGAPLERVHLDFLGPLPKTERGNEHVLMVVDQFTKWVECIPLPNQSAEVTAYAVVNDFFSRFGYPFQIMSDQGRNFESKLFAALCKAMQIHKTRTTPYRPSANGQVERFNRTLMDAVRCFVDGKQKNWDLHIAQIAGALRSSVNRSTGYTPNMMMLGREVNQPVDLLFPMKITEWSTDQHVAHLQKSLKKAHDTARKCLKTTQARMKRDYDLKIFSRVYDVGDLIYVLDTATIKGQCKKLGHPWKGPGIVINRFTSYLYRVKLINVVFTANHDRLKPCRDRKLPDWLERFQYNFKENLKRDQDHFSVGTHQPVYCICRNPDRGDLMIQCDFCTEWFHGTCVGVTTNDVMQIKKYKCPGCASVTKKGNGAYGC